MGERCCGAEEEGVGDLVDERDVWGEVLGHEFGVGGGGE